MLVIKIYKDNIWHCKILYLHISYIFMIHKINLSKLRKINLNSSSQRRKLLCKLTSLIEANILLQKDLHHTDMSNAH